MCSTEYGRDRDLLTQRRSLVCQCELHRDSFHACLPLENLDRTETVTLPSWVPFLAWDIVARRANQNGRAVRCPSKRLHSAFSLKGMPSVGFPVAVQISCVFWCALNKFVEKKGDAQGSCMLAAPLLFLGSHNDRPDDELRRPSYPAESLLLMWAWSVLVSPPVPNAGAKSGHLFLQHNVLSNGETILKHAPGDTGSHLFMTVGRRREDNSKT